MCVRVIQMVLISGLIFIAQRKTLDAGYGAGPGSLPL